MAGVSMHRIGTGDLYTEEPDAAREAAILFAAGYADAAVELLERETRRLGHAENPKPWLMLHEIQRLRLGRAAPESLAVPGMFRLDGVIASTADLQGMIEHARTRKMIGIDMGGVQRIDFNLAQELCALLRVYAQQGKRIILANIGEVHAELLEAVGGIAQVVLLRSRTAAQDRLAALQAA